VIQISRPTGRALESPTTPIMTAEETSVWLGFQSVNALLRARKRGALPIAMFQLPGRRGWFAARQAVVAWADASTKPYLTYQLNAGEVKR
jgi:hypothetical protein